MPASSKSSPLARWAIADAITTATASCHARRRRAASERESQMRRMPNASAPTRAAVGKPGGRTPCTRRTRSAISGVSADTTPSAPTNAAAQASNDSGLGLRSLTLAGYNVVMPTGPPLPRWLAPLLGLAALFLVPWTLWLTFSLPSRHVTDHYDLAWVGFDIVLAIAFAATAWATVRREQWLVPFAAVTGTMLICDAWFDVVTSQTGGEIVRASRGDIV